MTSPNPTRRQYLKLTGGTAAALFGATGVASADHSGHTEAAPLPSDTDDFDYGTMGDADAPVASVFGNFKCPYTQEFVLGNLSDVVEEYVEPGDLRLRFRSLAYEPWPDNPSHDLETYFISSSDPRIARVALGVWEADPDAYWRFNVSLFQDQPSGYVSYDDLRERLADANVDNRDRVIELAKSDTYEDELQATTERFNDLDMEWTPHMEMNGEVTGGPHHDRGDLFDWLDARLEEVATNDGGSDGNESSDDPSSNDSDDPSSNDSDGSSSNESNGDEDGPTDPDGDGEYEDVNGDGEADITDVTALFENQDDETIQDNPERFDFNDDGRIDIVDVTRLFNDI